MSELCHIPPETQVKHRRFTETRASTSLLRKVLVGTAVMRFGVRQHARAESIPSVLLQLLGHSNGAAFLGIAAGNSANRFKIFPLGPD